MHTRAGVTAAVAFAVALSAIIGPRESLAATVCVREHTVPYDCHCASCRCKTCYSCGCEAAAFGCGGREACSGGCWCSPLCSCCRTSHCSYACDCEQCCETCYRQECAEEVTYTVSAVKPTQLHASEAAGAGDVLVAGWEFRDTGNITCRWSWVGSAPSAVRGSLVSAGALSCPLPTQTQLSGAFTAEDAGVVSASVSVSLAGGASGSWAPAIQAPPSSGLSAAVVRLYRCGPWDEGEEECGGRGRCVLDDEDGAVCECSSGFGGRFCEVQCPVGGGGLTCSGNGECSASGRCVCDEGWSGSDCSTAVAACPPGRFVPNATVQEGTGETNGVDANCTGVCPGSSGCEGNGGVCAVVCSGRGVCGGDGQCRCNETLGHYGTACDKACPSTVEALRESREGEHAPVGIEAGAMQGVWETNAEPCGGADQGRCGSDGRCRCRPGLAGKACELVCPVAPAVQPPAPPAAVLGLAGLQGSGDDELVVCAGAGECGSESGACACNSGFVGGVCNLTCPGVDGCSFGGGEGGGATCSVVCSGHGVCADSDGDAVCACGAGWWGSDCSKRCDCTNGVCEQEDGSCSCLAGWVGEHCDLACPVGVDGSMVCSGHGRCIVASSGAQAVCQCSAGFNGSACETATCPGDCFGRGTCQPDGTCICQSGWQPPTCGEPVAPVSAGVVRWRSSPGTAPRAAGTVTLLLAREGSSKGEVAATWVCEGGTAVAGADYDCGGQGGGGGQTVSWADGEDGTKAVTIELLQQAERRALQASADRLPGDEVEVSFDVAVASVSPSSASLGSPSNVTLLLVPESLDRLMRQSVRVTLRLSASYTSVTRDGSDPAAARFREELVADLRAPSVLGVGAGRVAVAVVAPALGGEAVLATVLLLEADSGQGSGGGGGAGAASGVLASRLVELCKDVDGPLYAPQRTWSKLNDVSFEPVVTQADVSPTPAPPSPTPTAPGPAGWEVAVAVAVPMAVLAACGLLLARNRRAVAEWVLWRAGQMRFSTLQENDHRRALEDELDAIERREGTASASVQLEMTDLTPHSDNDDAAAITGDEEEDDDDHDDTTRIYSSKQ